MRKMMLKWTVNNLRQTISLPQLGPADKRTEESGSSSSRIPQAAAPHTRAAVGPSSPRTRASCWWGPGFLHSKVARQAGVPGQTAAKCRVWKFRARLARLMINPITQYPFALLHISPP